MNNSEQYIYCVPPKIPYQVLVPVYVTGGHLDSYMDYRSNTTPDVFEKEQVVNVVKSDEEEEVDVVDEPTSIHKVTKVSVIRPISAISNLHSPVQVKKEPTETSQVLVRKRKATPVSEETIDSEIVTKKPKDEARFEPETDDSLSEFTPRATFRVIEEHYQYRGDEEKEKDRQYKCQYCRKVFRRKEEKKRHENSHLNIRSHKCRLCDKTFMRADHRNSHEKTHSTEKEFKCLICNKSFRRADEAKRHEQRQIHLRNVARLEKKKQQEMNEIC